MPTYLYVCSKCKHEFEIVQSIKDEPLTVCPKHLCARKRWGKGAVKRQIGAGAGLLFRGSGFYITDYRSESYKAGAKKESASASTAGSGSSSSASSSSGGAGSSSNSGGSSTGSTSTPTPSSKSNSGAKPAK